MPFYQFILWIVIGGAIFVGFSVISALVRGYIKKLKDRRKKKDA